MKKLKKLNGTFQVGCGIVVADEKYNFYHLLVVEDRVTKKPCIELKNEVYFMADITNA